MHGFVTSQRLKSIHMFWDFFEWMVPEEDLESRKKFKKNIDFCLWGNYATTQTPNRHLKLEFFPRFSSFCILLLLEMPSSLESSLKKKVNLLFPIDLVQLTQNVVNFLNIIPFFCVTLFSRLNYKGWQKMVHHHKKLRNSLFCMIRDKSSPCK